jgi:hypothetical protein
VNTPIKEQVEEFAQRWDAFPVAPERRENAPWSENTLDGEDVDLFKVLPLPQRDAYPDEFRMTQADIDNAPEVPTIPPLLSRLPHTAH